MMSSVPVPRYLSLARSPAPSLSVSDSQGESVRVSRRASKLVAHLGRINPFLVTASSQERGALLNLDLTGNDYGGEAQERHAAGLPFSLEASALYTADI